MKFEDDVVRFLMEGRIEDAIGRYPKCKDTLLALRNSKLKKPARYIDWAVKQTKSSEKADDILSLLLLFESFEQRLKEKDINAYATLNDLRDAIESLGASNREVREKAKEGAEKIFENNKAYVYYIPTKEAAQYYGKGTRWCIAAIESENHFDEYKKLGQVFFFVMAKKSAGSKYDKVALNYQMLFGNVELVGLWTANDEQASIKVPSSILLMDLLGVEGLEGRKLLERLKDHTASVAVNCTKEMESGLESRFIGRIPSLRNLMLAVDKGHIDYAADIYKDLQEDDMELALDYILSMLSPEEILKFVDLVDETNITKLKTYFRDHPGLTANRFFKTLPTERVEVLAPLLALEDVVEHRMSYSRVRELLGDHYDQWCDKEARDLSRLVDLLSGIRYRQLLTDMMLWYLKSSCWTLAQAAQLVIILDTAIPFMFEQPTFVEAALKAIKRIKIFGAKAARANCFSTYQFFKSNLNSVSSSSGRAIMGVFIDKFDELNYAFVHGEE